MKTFLRTYFFAGHTIVASSVSHRIMTLLVGLLGSLVIFGCFSCVMFMPVGDATTLLLTNPLFTIIVAAVFLGQGITLIKTISGSILQLHFVLL